MGSKDPRYTKAKRNADKAWKSLDSARTFLMYSVPEDAPYSQERAAMDAMDVLESASKKVGAELDKVSKELGVGVYTPYGRR